MTTYTIIAMAMGKKIYNKTVELNKAQELVKNNKNFNLYIFENKDGVTKKISSQTLLNA